MIASLVAKIASITLFIVVSIVFLPIVFIAARGAEYYEKWWESILDF